MSIALYDDALTQKLQYWTQDTKLHVFNLQDSKRVFEVEADENNDKAIQLPMITISRNGGYTLLNTSKKPLSFDGVNINATFEKSLQLNAIPISISYQIDVYTRYLKEADEIMRNLVFNIINHPKLTVCIPYNGQNINHVSNIRMKEEIQDNSSIPERLSLGQFTRLSVSILIDDAYLWDTRVRNNIRIVGEIDENK